MSSLDYDRDRDALAAVVFPFDRELVELIKTIPGRQYEATGRRWMIPAAMAEQVLAALLPAGFHPTTTFLEQFPSTRQEVSREVPQEVSREVSVPSPALPGLRVGELLERVRGVLRRSFDQPIWVIGTVIGFERNAGKPNPQFQLAEFDEKTKSVRASARVRMFERDASRILKRFLEASIEFRDELKVLIQVKVDFWAERGEFQLVAIDADASYTAADLGKVRELHYERLRRDGIAERNLVLPWPSLPLRVGLVAAAGSEGLSDFLNELERSGLPFEVFWADCRMQGPETAVSVARGLSLLSGQGVELIAIVRGGGAEADLSWFNDYALGKAVCLCPVPILVGIGHHRDRTLLDMIARFEKTPTAAGGSLVRLVSESVEQRMERMRRALSGARDKVMLARSRLEQREFMLQRLPERLERRRLLLASCVERLRGASNRLSGKSREIELLGERFRSSLDRVFERSRHSFALKELSLNSHDPLRQLARGFALVSRTDGKRVRMLSELPVGSDFILRLPDGTARATLKEINTIEESEPNDGRADHP